MASFYFDLAVICGALVFGVYTAFFSSAAFARKTNYPVVITTAILAVLATCVRSADGGLFSLKPLYEQPKGGWDLTPVYGYGIEIVSSSIALFRTGKLPLKNCVVMAVGSLWAFLTPSFMFRRPVFDFVLMFASVLALMFLVEALPIPDKRSPHIDAE